MATVSKHIERLLVVLSETGEVKGVSIEEATSIDGKQVASELVGISSLDDARLTPLKSKINIDAAAEVVELREQLQNTVTVESHNTVLTELSEAKTEIAKLTAMIPEPLPERHIAPRDFLARISTDDQLAIFESTDPRCRMAMLTLFTTLSVDLDSPILSDLVDGLIDAGIKIDDEERARIFA